jgi:hypothetical protein
MPKLTRGAGPIGLALTAYDVWRRLSPRQKQLLVKQAKKYGPHAAQAARTAATSLRARRGGR